MKLDITNHHFEELIKKGYSIDMIVMLDWINRNLDVTEMCKNSIKIKAIYNTMIRKGLITSEETLTENGIEILDFISKKTNKKFNKKKIEISEFDEWWFSFPSTDIFTHKGKKFKGSRSLRTSKEKCRLLFNKFIIDKKYTKKQIIDATMYDVELKKNNSVRNNKNNLSFLQNSYTYLLNESFESFIEFGSPTFDNSTKQIGSTDI